MTVLSPTAHVAPPVSVLRDRVRLAWFAHVTVAALLLWWAWPMTRGTGGRDPHVLSVGLVLLAAAFAATTAWRGLPGRAAALVASIPVAAYAVCLVSPTGWSGANDAASFTFAAGTFLVVRAYASSVQRRQTLLALVALAGVLEFAEGWLPWWGGGDPSHMMWGTFYWHDQFAAFLLPAAVIGLALVAWPARPYRLVGWVAVPLCSAGVLFSTSRTMLALLLLGWVAVAAALAARPDRRRTLPRLLAAGVLTVATAFLLTGPPFFAHRSSPTSAVSARDKTQSAQGNGLYRTQMWDEAVIVFRAHPVAGTGFHGFGAAAAELRPTWHHSAFVHDAWLQAFSDGGVLFGVPFLAASLALVGGVLRRGWRQRRASIDMTAAVIGPIAWLLLVAHSLVDFDMTYPSLLALIAVLGAVVWRSGPPEIAPIETEQPVATRDGRRALAAVALAAGLVGVAVPSAWHGGLSLNVGLHAARANGGAQNGAAR